MGHVPSLCVLCSPYKPLRPLLFAFVPLLISFPTKGPLAYVACDRKVSWFCLLCNLVLQMALHSFLDVVASRNEWILIYANSLQIINICIHAQ